MCESEDCDYVTIVERLSQILSLQLELMLVFFFLFFFVCVIALSIAFFVCVLLSSPLPVFFIHLESHQHVTHRYRKPFTHCVVLDQVVKPLNWLHWGFSPLAIS